MSVFNTQGRKELSYTPIIGAMQFVGEAIVAGSAATTLTISGLDLAADESYYVEITMLNATAATPVLSMFYNGDTTATNYDSQFFGAAGASSNGNVGANTAAICTSLGASGYWQGQLIIRNSVGGQPIATGQYANFNNGSTRGAQFGSHNWRTAANVTSITLSTPTANSFAVGSTVRVYRINKTGVLPSVSGAYIPQTSGLVITSNAVYQDTQLATGLVAGTYAVSVVALCDVNSTPDMNIILAYTGTVTSVYGERNAQRYTNAASSESRFNSLATSEYLMNDTSIFRARFDCELTVSNGGTFSMQAKQASSSGTSVTFMAGSHMRVTRLF